MAEVKLKVIFDTSLAQRQVKEMFNQAAENKGGEVTEKRNRLEQLTSQIYTNITAKILAKIAIIISLLESVQPITDLLKLIAFSAFYIIGKGITEIVNVYFPMIGDLISNLTKSFGSDITTDKDKNETEQVDLTPLKEATASLEKNTNEIETETEKSISLFDKLSAAVLASSNILLTNFFNLENVLNSVKTIISKLGDSVSSFVNDITDHIKSILQPLWNKITDGFDGLVEKGKEVASDIVNNVKKTIIPEKKETSSRSSSSRSSSKRSSSSSSSKKTTPAPKKTTPVKKPVSNIIKKTVTEGVKKVTNVVKKVTTPIVKKAAPIVKKVTDTVKKTYNTIKKTVSNVVNKAKNIFRGLFGDVIINKDGSHYVPSEFQVKTAIGTRIHRRVFNYYGVASPDMYDYVKRELGGIGLSTISRL